MEIFDKYDRGYKVSSLLNCCFDTLLKNTDKNFDWEMVRIMPPHLKSRFLLCLSKRGLVTDENLLYLIDEMTLSVEFGDCDMSDEGIRQLAVCRNLQKLDLGSSHAKVNFTYVGLIEVFPACHYLTFVSLRNCVQVDDNTILALAKNCPYLSLLNVNGCHLLGDMALQSLAENCPMLEGLDLSFTKISDLGILSLSSSQCAGKLKEVGLKNCQLLTDCAIEALLHQCPNLTILIFHGCPRITECCRQSFEDFLSAQTRLKQISWTF